uniref:UDP-glucose--hexose-1-phosphate uridylyltransferase n=1 Tax=Eubacterium cellulosolvens TaxID=29322 RepID=UPI000487F7CB|nr:UDP-glucose--hexose-1-phosphate uridylyltransferase [[Eubacterium] cellulosolvens]
MTKMQNVENAVRDLVAYAVDCGLIVEEEMTYAANSIMDVLGVEPDFDFSPEDGEVKPLEGILKVLLDDAVERGIIDGGIASRDLFDTRIMGCVTPRPGEFLRNFREKYAGNPKDATDYFYKLSCDCDYIRRYRICKDRKWVSSTPYGDLDITINLSKPEKDPKAIAAALNKKQESYPKCLLCHENEGYAGRLDHPARQTIRLVPLTLAGQRWYMQYSPYVYYNEHCIVLSGEHTPMKISRKTFESLFDFLKEFPHYTIGSNADLPIVGGSILTHEHYQGGNYVFAMAKADVREQISFKGFEDVKAGILHWPMSVIRLDGSDPDRLIELADRILTAWRGYSDPEAEIYAMTEETPHNTITPIARMRDGAFELDLVLRNNRTSEEYPLGIFHPHQELHHIKKENIGLIEVMGLAVLPARLLGEMEELKTVMLAGGDIRGNEKIAAHADWAEEIRAKYADINGANIDRIIEDEIGLVFAKVLEDAGVYKDTEAGHAAFTRFVDSVR